MENIEKPSKIAKTPSPGNTVSNKEISGYDNYSKADFGNALDNEVRNIIENQALNNPSIKYTNSTKPKGKQ